MLDRSEVGKRGYLNEDYRLFHLRDSRARRWVTTTTSLTSWCSSWEGR